MKEVGTGRANPAGPRFLCLYGCWFFPRTGRVELRNRDRNKARRRERQEQALVRAEARATRSPAEQLRVILARGASTECKEARRLTAQINQQ